MSILGQTLQLGVCAWLVGTWLDHHHHHIHKAHAPCLMWQRPIEVQQSHRLLVENGHKQCPPGRHLTETVTGTSCGKAKEEEEKAWYGSKSHTHHQGSRLGDTLT